MPANQSKIDLQKYNQPQNMKTAADWIRDLRFNNEVNRSTLGVDTDRVSPELMLAASSKLLKISRGESQGDPKDSLQYQRFYGPVEYFAEHIQKDAGSVARSLLWKATNKGTVQNIPTNALQAHINSVFNGSLAQFVDNSTPMDGVDNAMKVTRVGEGGVSSQDQVPIEMRLVQPSYLGYIDPARCYSWDTEIYTKEGWKYLKDLTVRDIVACLIDNKLEWHKPQNITSYIYAGMMYCYEDQKIGFKVTPRHRMYIKPSDNDLFRIAQIQEVQQNVAPCTFLTVNSEDPSNTEEYKISLNSYRTTYQIYYNGTVYCPTVPGGLVLVRRVSGFDKEYGSTGFWCGNTAQKCVTPETEVTCVDQNDNLFTVCAKDLTLKHRVLCNIDGEVTAQYPNEINIYDHDGPLFCYKNGNGVSFRVTEHHRLYIAGSKKESDKGDFHFEQAKDAFGKDFYLSVKAQNGVLQTVYCPKTGWYIQQYKGKVYCPTVPGGMIYITGQGNPLNKQSFWCGNSPGVTGYVTKNIMKGTDGKLYRPFYNTKTGKEELVDSQTAARSVVTTSEYKNSKDKYVYAVGGERGVRIVPYKDVNYILPYSDEMFSMSANAVPMASGAKPMRLLMGCLHPDTSIVFADEHGYTDIVPAKLLGDTSKTYLMGCTKNGEQQLQQMSKIVPRFPDKKKKFRRVILKSGRVLNTSHDHKWYIYDNKQFKLIRAQDLKPGMIVPRSMFLTMPVRLTEILGVTITKELCVLMGCLMRSLENSGKVYRFRYIDEQYEDIMKAFEQLTVISYNKYDRNGSHYISLTDDRFLAWLDKEMSLQLEKRRVPKAILSLPEGYTAYVLDAYSKDKENIGYDTVGDVWLLDIPSAYMRDGLSFMLNKIYTDTIYHDFHTGDKLNRALQLTPAKSDLNDVVLDEIHAVVPVPNPGLMIDIDCNDNVYAAGNGIITHNSKYTNQAVSLQNRQASLVQSLDEATGKTMQQIIGRHLGTQWAPKAGTVQAVRKDRIDMLYDDGTKGSVPLYENFPSNAKGWITNYPQVKAGQHVSKDQLLASSNYTDDKGVAALGRNLRVAYMSYKGGTYQDGCTLSQTGAKKMGYTTMYQTAMDLNKSIRTSKSLYHTWKPQQYTKQQLQNIDDQGIVKPGTVLHKGDPMILGIQTTEPSPGTLGKRLLTDVTQVWQHHYPGVVTDIARTKNGVKVLAQVSQPFQIGDKLSGFQGSKGTVARIIPDDQMPKDSKGRPIQLLFDPLGIVSRCYDQKTEFLTQDGWKFGKDVLDTDILYCYNPEDDTCDWMPQQDSFHRQQYKGFMYGAFSNYFDFLVTVDHKVWVNIHKQWQQKKIQQIYASVCMLPVMGFTKQQLPDPTGTRVGTKEYIYNLQHQFTVRGYWSSIVLVDQQKKLYALRVFPKNFHSALVKMPDWYKTYYEGMVYCPTVPTGYVVTRRNGKVVCMGNTNPSQMIEAALGKVAQKTGKPIVVPQFSPNGQSRLQWAKSVLKQNNVPWKQTLTDPETGRQIKDIFVGVNYYLPLKHIADTKMSARGTGTYTSQQVPSSGGQEGCFPAQQKIQTTHGQVSIAELADASETQYAWSYDKLSKQWDYNPITDHFIREASIQDLLDITVEINLKGSRKRVHIYPTKNHNMYLADDSVVPAQKLSTGSRLRGVHPCKVIKVSPYKPQHPSITRVKVYDITVDRVHNYCLTGGVNVSNSKRLGSLQSAALVGHNAFDFLVTDAKLIRGQSNADFWRSIQTGTIPVIPGQPLVHKKFFNHLTAAGMRIQRNTKGISIMALTNKDVNQLAGNRQLKTRDTYQQKNFRPIDGGLFGQDIFGQNGDAWGYIQLDQPLPNPVMQQPLARILNIPIRDFKAVCLGKIEVNGMKNASDVKKALSKLDIRKQTMQALQEFKSAKNSAKDNALKRYVALAQMKDSGHTPDQYMLDRIPVLPPKFRPVSTHNGLTMVADSNYLYAQMLDARNDLRDAKDLPVQYQNKARQHLYNSWQQLVGLTDPSDMKLKSKNVGGLLKWALALGNTPKMSAFYRKVYGSTVDTVGRGVVVPDSRIKLNQIAMPWDMAWNVYAPFVTRKLVQANYTPVQAMKMVKAHAQLAKPYLLEAMDERPVVMNRAPSLHKLSLMGFNAKPTTGTAIHVNPSIVVPYNMDFDGDSIWNAVRVGSQVDVSNTNFEESQNGLDICKSDAIVCLKAQEECENTNNRRQTMLDKNAKIRSLIHTMALSEVPVVEGSEVQKSPTVTEWDVKGSVVVPTIDIATGNVKMAYMTKVSRHTGLKMYDCTMSISNAYSHVVTASDDHSLITLNSSTLELEKTRPEDAKGRCVPMVSTLPVNDPRVCIKYLKLGKQYPLSYELGVFLGTMLGDGWVDSNYRPFIACCDPSFQQYITEHFVPSSTLPFTKVPVLHWYKADEARFSKDDRGRFSIFMDVDDCAVLKKRIGTGAYNKMIPWECLTASRTHLVGILVGLLATDGHIGISKTASKKATTKNVAYHTTSGMLRDNIQELCKRLNVKTRVTPYKGKNSKATCYEIGFCLEDLAKLKQQYPDQFKIPVDYKEEALVEICNDLKEGSRISYNIVPFPRGLFCEFSWADVTTVDSAVVIPARKKGYIRRDVALRIAEHLEKQDWETYSDPVYLKNSDRTNHTPEQAKALVDKWISMVRDESIGWEVVDKVTPCTCTEGWDCTVPGPYTFALSTGTIVQDTVNLHVPVSKNAIKNVRQNMMPERNLISARKHEILYKPQKAYLQGLYVATRMDTSKPVKTFNSLQEAKQAYRDSLIDIDSPIVIKGK